MNTTSIFDIVGPVMIGPSSSHTAGAVRIGFLSRKIFGEQPQKVNFTLYNSFASTGKGHGTDKGLLGGVLGFNVNDTKIKHSEKFANDCNIEFNIKFADNLNRHPNSVDLEFSTENRSMIIAGNSLGAGEVQICAIDGFKVDISGNYPTLLLIYKDKPGIISLVTNLIQKSKINIATLNCERTAKGEEATMTICLDSNLPPDIMEDIKKLPDMYVVRNIEALEK